LLVVILTGGDGELTSASAAREAASRLASMSLTNPRVGLVTALGRFTPGEPPLLVGVAKDDVSNMLRVAANDGSLLTLPTESASALASSNDGAR